MNSFVSNVLFTLSVMIAVALMVSGDNKGRDVYRNCTSNLTNSERQSMWNSTLPRTDNQKCAILCIMLAHKKITPDYKMDAGAWMKFVQWHYNETYLAKAQEGITYCAAQDNTGANNCDTANKIDLCVKQRWAQNQVPPPMRGKWKKNQV